MSLTIRLFGPRVKIFVAAWVTRLSLGALVAAAGWSYVYPDTNDPERLISRGRSEETRLAREDRRAWVEFRVRYEQLPEREQRIRTCDEFLESHRDHPLAELVRALRPR